MNTDERISQMAESLSSLEIPDTSGKREVLVKGDNYLFDLQPGDSTRYLIMVSPLSSEMGKKLHCPFGRFHMVTVIRGDVMRSFPVDLNNIWDAEYIKEKFGFNDQYTHKAVKMLLGYISSYMEERN